MTKEEILDYFKDINFYYNDCSRYDSLKYMLDELQPTGEWKQRGRASFGFADFECTNCHCIAEAEPVKTFGYNYCPTCGAKMKGGEET